MGGPYGPTPAGGHYIFVGVLAVVVFVLGIMVMSRPQFGPAGEADSLSSYPAAPAGAPTTTP